MPKFNHIYFYLFSFCRPIVAELAWTDNEYTWSTFSLCYLLPLEKSGLVLTKHLHFCLSHHLQKLFSGHWAKVFGTVPKIQFFLNTSFSQRLSIQILLIVEDAYKLSLIHIDSVLSNFTHRYLLLAIRSIELYQKRMFRVLVGWNRCPAFPELEVKCQQLYFLLSVSGKTRGYRMTN